jgi:CBS-domain-containing membrane protein
MQKDYSPLLLYPMQSDVSYFRPQQDLPERVVLDSPALFVMTDLRRVPAVTIEANVPIPDALKTMRREGVRMLLVTDAQDVVQGLITSTDIQGEKPMKFLEQMGGHHDEIEVHNIMTPHARLEVLRMSDVLRAAVGDIVATLQRAGRQHALVVDEPPALPAEMVRGIFSASQISRQLAMPLEILGPAQSFAELEMALNG